MKTVLITGFEAFGGEANNPSAEIARALEGRMIARRRMVAAVLPCVFGDAIAELKRQMRLHRPELVVSLGLAAGRPGITPERIAINVDDARIADNAGAQPVDMPVVKGGPAAYWSTLPVKAMVVALRDRGIPASVSSTAGTFVCNHVFYGLMHALRRRPGVRGGFIHVPSLSENATAGQASLPLTTMIEAIAFAVAVALRTRRDLKFADGTTD